MRIFGGETETDLSSLEFLLMNLVPYWEDMAILFTFLLFLSFPAIQVHNILNYPTA